MLVQVCVQRYDLGKLVKSCSPLYFSPEGKNVEELQFVSGSFNEKKLEISFTWTELELNE